MNLSFHQLTDASLLSERDLNDLAELIWDTDPYIYPAMFYSRSDAIVVLSALIKMAAPMFGPQHLFVCKTNNEIVGLILWLYGPNSCSLDLVRKVASANNIALPPSLELSFCEYFSHYSRCASNVISIVNICVKKSHRKMGIGQTLLNHFCFTKPDHQIELLVLADNLPAIKCYERCGFILMDSFDGFSTTNEKPLCHLMIRPSSGNPQKVQG